jgi:hypothetical protein
MKYQKLKNKLDRLIRKKMMSVLENVEYQKAEKQFLLDNSFLIWMVDGAMKELAHYFEPVKFSLELFQYSDGDDQKLFLNVHTNLDPEEAFPLFVEFEEDWWIKQLDRVQGKMNITLEYI